jgi:hypothetical protein
MPNPAGNPEHLPRRPGRPLGAKNKTPEKLRQAVLQALENKGGVRYLEALAENEPKAFAMLLGKVLPRQIDVDAEIQVTHRDDEITAALIAGRDRVAKLRGSVIDGNVLDHANQETDEAAGN